MQHLFQKRNYMNTLYNKNMLKIPVRYQTLNIRFHLIDSDFNKNQERFDKLCYCDLSQL